MNHCGDQLTACGITWDASDIARFLNYCQEDHTNGCLVWAGAKSRGRGNTAWYGSFGPTAGHSVRAHKFYAVAVLGLRPDTHLHHLDHCCPNSLCVRHIDCVPISVNLKLRWIRVQVGLDPEPDYDTAVKYRMQSFLLQCGPAKFGYDAPRLWQRWGLPESTFCPDAFDPRYWPDYGADDPADTPPDDLSLSPSCHDDPPPGPSDPSEAISMPSHPLDALRGTSPPATNSTFCPLTSSVSTTNTR